MLRSLMFIFAVALSACGGGDGASFAPATGNTHCGVSVGKQRISGVVTAVHDGDTITVGGESIRLASIDAPELDQAYGPSSRAHLTAMVLGQSVTVTYAQKDLYDRVVGTVFKPDCSQVNLNQVLAGAAWYFAAYQCEIDLRQRLVGHHRCGPLGAPQRDGGQSARYLPQWGCGFGLMGRFALICCASSQE
jgi:endonuclease YncB( thermonuclease family)